MELILMVGIPGSGKSTTAQKLFPNHIIISRDRISQMSKDEKAYLLKTYNEKYGKKLDVQRKREYVLIEDARIQNKNIVIDNVNIDRNARRPYIEYAKRHNYSVKALFFKNIQAAYEQNRKREKRLDDAILTKYVNRLEPPNKDEGIEYIQVINHLK